MTDKENDNRENKLSDLASDPAHPFDQTNGIVDGLDGDADAPEQVDKRTETGDGTAFLAVPAPGSQMTGGAIPVVPADSADEGPEAGADADSDDPTPA